MTTTTKLVLAGMIALLSIAVYASISSTQAAFADTHCPKGSQGSGNPHDAENPHNPHDSQLGFKTGNPHDACAGS